MVNHSSLKKAALFVIQCHPPIKATHCTRGVWAHAPSHNTLSYSSHTSHTPHPPHTHTSNTHTHSHLPHPPPTTHTQHLNEQIAHLKDQLQELKAKTNLEAKYVKKETQVGTIPSKVHCLQSNFTLCKYPNTQILFFYGRVWESVIECDRVW